ncbi:tetratricopeptide repeat protein [Actinokineospora pegani]|uniref:tetratricopeptide repeat protein n=1 Tax=Actinokineospora pegani TaxID=2654637 RepID=UPI0018D3D17D|nr:tetratricopeptide repeat protein [Actinokineospora pegani]
MRWHQAKTPVNSISGGVFVGTVIQGKEVTLTLPPKVEPALGGLPRSITGLIGRDSELAEVVTQFEGHGSGSCLVTGLGGVGKTALAVEAAHVVRERGLCPGGVLFLDLHGYEKERLVSASDGLGSLLRSLAVPGEHVPEGADDRARLFRTILDAFAANGRPLLLVLDNVSSRVQVEPLLPGDKGTGVLITSRHTLDVDARLCELGVLDSSDSVTLLQHVLRQRRGAVDTRVEDNPRDCELIAKSCAGLPLALNICGALLADSPARPPASLAAALDDGLTRLDRLSREDRAVRVAFDLSYEDLADRPATLLRLLPVAPGADWSTHAAALLLEVDDHTAEELLRRLSTAHLVEPGDVWGRWRLHDLIRLYADEHGHARADSDGRNGALARLLDGYSALALDATARLREQTGEDSTATLVKWLAAEQANLIAAVPVAAAAGHQAAIDLAVVIAPYLIKRGEYDSVLMVTAIAKRAAIEAGDRFGEGLADYHRSRAQRACLQIADSIASATDATTIFGEIGTRPEHEIAALRELGVALRLDDREDEALPVAEKRLRLSLKLADPHDESLAWQELGLTLVENGSTEAGLAAGRRALAIAQELDAPSVEANAWCTMGQLLRLTGHFKEAVTSARLGRDLYRQHGHHRAAAMASNGLGLVLLSMGDTADALAEITAANEYLTSLPELLYPQEAQASALHVLFAEDQSEMAAIATRLQAAGQAELADMVQQVDPDQLVNGFLDDLRELSADDPSRPWMELCFLLATLERSDEAGVALRHCVEVHEVEALRWPDAAEREIHAVFLKEVDGDEDALLENEILTAQLCAIKPLLPPDHSAAALIGRLIASLR